MVFYKFAFNLTYIKTQNPDVNMEVEIVG